MKTVAQFVENLIRNLARQLDDRDVRGELKDDTILVSFHKNEGFYSWVIYKDGMVTSADEALRERVIGLKSHGWYGSSEVSHNWYASHEGDLDPVRYSKAMEQFTPFILTLREFRDWLNQQIHNGQIKCLEADPKPPVKLFEDRVVTYVVDGQQFKTQEDLNKYLAFMKLVDLLEAGGKVPSRYANELGKFLLANKALAAEVLAGASL